LKRYRIIGLIIFFSVSLCAQEPEKANILKYISIGADLSGPAAKILNPGKSELEMNIVIGNFNNFQFDAEAGFFAYNLKADTGNSYNYSSSGNFGRFGFDYNTFKKNLPGENNYVLFGLRYGISTMQHNANNIVIRDKNWGDRQANFSESNINSRWFEITGGLRIQIYRNIGAGWTARFKYMLDAGVNAHGVKPYYIPGFGKGADNTALGFTYSLYYTFPIVKMKIE
jgi:hypothetical protein